MTSTYTPEPATYAWSESDRQFGRPYSAPDPRPGWYDERGLIDRQILIGRPDPAPSGNSSSLNKTAIVAALVAAVGGGALLGTFVFSNHQSATSPSVYMLPESSGAPVAAPAPGALPPAPNTDVVPGPTSTRTVIVPPANRGPAPVAVPAPPAVAPAPPRPANVPPPPPAPAQVRIEGIPLPFPVPQVPDTAGQNNDGKKPEDQNPKDQNAQDEKGTDECTAVPDLSYCKKPDTGGGNGAGGGTSTGGGAGGSNPSTNSGGGGGADPAPGGSNATTGGQFDTGQERAKGGPPEAEFPSGLTTSSTTQTCIDPQSLRNC
jgi:hypothetical protein